MTGNWSLNLRSRWSCLSSVSSVKQAYLFNKPMFPLTCSRLVIILVSASLGFRAGWPGAIVIKWKRRSRIGYEFQQKTSWNLIQMPCVWILIFPHIKNSNYYVNVPWLTKSCRSDLFLMALKAKKKLKENWKNRAARREIVLLDSQLEAVVQQNSVRRVTA